MTAPRECDNLCPSVLSDEIFVWLEARALFIREKEQVALRPPPPPGGWDGWKERVGLWLITWDERTRYKQARTHRPRELPILLPRSHAAADKSFNIAATKRPASLRASLVNVSTSEFLIRIRSSQDSSSQWQIYPFQPFRTSSLWITNKQGKTDGNCGCKCRFTFSQQQHQVLFTLCLPYSIFLLLSLKTFQPKFLSSNHTSILSYKYLFLFT